ncbi:hypothetical protein ONE63_005197 [Megalurothrips usitatus]|uniref:MOSC domain-containing protein n=1 Tax=Megalurothrips usitatus TaxID=439358 RepID=A0AAV7XVN2_9NEOP|nr:hypothetical protein ONE63_005197 [Megalurothrips usitatus]
MTTSKSVTAQESADGRVLFELRSPKVEEVLTLDPTTFSKRTKKITVWHAPVSAVDCGEAAAVWLRKAVVVPSVHPEDSPNAKLRLVFFPFEHTDRAPIPLVPQHMRGIYTDETSYHLCTVSSVEEPNKRLAKPLPVRQFRPNFLVEGPPAFDEDNWSWVRIGSKAIFKVHMSCGRCAMTTIDPDTGVKSSECEPLKT